MTEFELPAAHYMLSPVHSVRDTTRLAAAARTLEELGLSALPVVDGAGRLSGLLDRSDLVRVGRLRGSRTEPRWWLPDISVAECMQSSVPVVNRSTPLRDCARRMLERDEHRLFVVMDRELEGVVGTTEILRAVAKAQPSLPIGEMANERAPTIAAEAPLSLAIEGLSASSGRPLVVLEGDRPTGVFSRDELAVCLEAAGAEATRLWQDPHVIALGASTPAHRAAELAMDADARYIIASHGAGAHSVIRSLAFAAIVADLPLTAAERSAGPALRPAVSLGVPDYPRDVSENTRATAPIDTPPAPRHEEKDAAAREREVRRAAEPAATEPTATEPTATEPTATGPIRAEGRQRSRKRRGGGS